jgi:hypothetical protein
MTMCFKKAMGYSTHVEALEGNEQVASNLAPAVNDFLRKLEA